MCGSLGSLFHLGVVVGETCLPSLAAVERCLAVEQIADVGILDACGPELCECSEGDVLTPVMRC